MSTLNGPLMRLIWTVAHMNFKSNVVDVYTLIPGISEKGHEPWGPSFLG